MASFCPEQAGDLAAKPNPRGGRDLLPFEIDLCNILNFTADEYLYFCELSDSYNGKRAKEYEYIPDVVGIPVVPLVVSLVVGVAATAVSQSMAPKPSAPKPVAQPVDQSSSVASSIKTGDITGPKRFSSISSFEGTQTLAALGSVIPLVFANRRNNRGGVRSKLMLVWSQLLSTGASQQMKAVFIAGMGPLGVRPEFRGFAIGDLLLKSYTNAKLAVYYTEGGRISEAHRYPPPRGELAADPAVELCNAYNDRVDGYRPMFSGTRSADTQALFGLFNPVVNGQGFWVNYELVTIPISTKQMGDLQGKQRKIVRWWSSHAAVYGTSQGGNPGQSYYLKPGDEVYYVIGEGEEHAQAFPPWGLTDVNSISETRRIIADDTIKLGEVFMIGSATCVCEWVQGDDVWNLSMRKHFRFKVTEAGTVRPANFRGQAMPWLDIVQKLTTASVTNNRACDQTEIGIKSTVWQQVNGFQNVNSKPSQYDIDRMQEQDISIQLGTVQKYIKRYSFFKFAYRPVEGGDWRDLGNGKLFCVQGQSPVAQYNYLRVQHALGQYEFKFTPVAGSIFLSDYFGSTVFILGVGKVKRIQTQDASVTFSGYEHRITPRDLCNSVWWWGSPPSEIGGIVTGLTDYGWGLQARPPRGEDSGNYRDGEEWTENWEVVREVEAQGGSGRGLVLKVTTFWSRYSNLNGAREETLQGESWVIARSGEGYNTGDLIIIQAERQSQSRVTSVDVGSLDGTYNLNDAICDIGKFEAQGFSHDSNPEHQIAYINEQLFQDKIPQYNDLSLFGLRLNAGKEWSSFNQFSAYIKHGIMIDRLIDDNGNAIAEGSLRASTNNLPEIVYALLTDKLIGAGTSIGVDGVSRGRMQEAAAYCHRMGFTWDGIIADRLNLRNWIFEQAGYCLLDFTILGGRFALFPSLPANGIPQIKALFTDGNMKDLKVSWLSPEERKLFKAVVSYRVEVENAFSRVRTLTVRLADDQGGSDYDPEEQFDCSGFCTNREQALMFAQYALKLRRDVDHGIVFETTPAASLSLAPGEYARVVSEVMHTSRFNNGSIDSSGYITSTNRLENGSYSIIYWKPGTTEVLNGTMTVSDGRTNDYFSTIFTLATTSATSRVYKVETIDRGDEGFAQIALSHAPMIDNRLTVADWNLSHFRIYES
jgi:hypothetical protein